MACLMTKYEIEKNFHEWLNGFSDKTRFEQVVDWEFSYCVQSGKRDKSEVDEKQAVFTPLGHIKNPERYSAKLIDVTDKDVRQGNLRR